MIPVDILNYQLVRLIGRDSLGEVYLARDKGSSTMVEVHAFAPKYASNRALCSRFCNEAVALNTLKHPNILRILNFVENEYGAFLITEHVEGNNLQDFVTKKNGLIVEEHAVPMLNEMLDALIAAYKHGIRHYNLQPSNIIIGNDGHVRIAEFGIAQILTECASGTKERNAQRLVYVSPEQARGGHVNQRSDIYSLGAIFYMMLTGRAPFDFAHSTEEEALNVIARTPLPKMKEAYPYISDRMQGIVDQATAKNPSKRYASFSEMKDILNGKVVGKGLSKLVVVGSVVASVLFAVACLGIWDYMRTKTTYYLDYVEVNGVAQGIGKISSSQLAQCHHAYCIESTHWQTTRLTKVDHKGLPIAASDHAPTANRPVNIIYTYDDRRNLVARTLCAPDGSVKALYTYDANLEIATVKTYDSAADAVARHTLTRDAEGRVVKELYTDSTGKVLVHDASYAYGREYVYDAAGHITEIHVLGEDKAIHSDMNGVAIIRYNYSSNGLVTSVSYLSSEKQPVNSAERCSVIKMKRDAYGNCINETYYGTGMQPVARTDNGAYGINYTYNNGKCTELTYLSADGKTPKSVNGVAKVAYEYDANGFLVKTSFLNASANLTANYADHGISVIKCTNDAEGRVLSRAYYDAHLNAMEDGNGIHMQKMTYDDSGKRTSIKSFNKKLVPIE